MKNQVCIAFWAAAFLFSCTQPKNDRSSTKEDERAARQIKREQIALRALKVYPIAEIDSVYRDYSDDCVEYGNGFDSPIRNLDSIEADYRNFRVAFTEIGVESLNAFSKNDSVIVVGVWSGTFSHDDVLHKVKATGKSYRSIDVDIFRFNEVDKIVSHSTVQAGQSYYAQLGIPVGK